MKFSYKARTKDGHVESGVIEASSKDAALEVLGEYNLYPTMVKPVRGLLEDEISFISPVSKNDVIIFTRQMSILSKSNLPIVESLETISAQMGSPAFKEKILELSAAVEGGSSLSQSFKKFPDIFSPFYIGMLRAGEKSGNMPDSFKYLADYMEKNRRLKGQLMGALLYPSFVIISFFVLMMLMSAFIVPNFEKVFAGMEMELPTSTRIVMAASKVLNKVWWLIALILGIAVALLSHFFKRKEVKERLDRVALKVPVMGGILKKIYLSRVALNLATLIAGGVSISDALEITSELVGNSVYKDIVLKTRKEVRSGRRMGSIFSLYPNEFSELFLQMITSGERTGTLDKTLRNVVEFYDDEVERSLSQLLKFIEPTLIVFLGGAVAFLSVSMFLPLFQTGTFGF